MSMIYRMCYERSLSVLPSFSSKSSHSFLSPLLSHDLNPVAINLYNNRKITLKSNHQLFISIIINILSSNETENHYSLASHRLLGTS